MGDGAEYAVDAAMAFFLGGFSRASKAASFAENVINAAARRAMGRVEVRLREPRHIPENQRGEIEHQMHRGRGHFSREEARGSGLQYTPNHPPRDTRLPREFRRRFENTATRIHQRNPEALSQVLERGRNCDVDHRIPLSLGGNDVRGNLTFKNRILNRSEGGQLGNQLRGAREGAQVHVEFE
jgi:hypothetical protein